MTRNSEPSGNGGLDLVPLESFLHRVFPLGVYKDQKEDIIEKRIFKPRKDCDNFSLTVPIDWEARDRMADRNWRMQLQGWTAFHPIMNFFDEYDNKEIIITFFFEVISDWWKNHEHDRNDIITDRMPESYAWYDMSVGFRALIIAFFKGRIDYFGLELSRDQSNLLDNLAIKHAVNLSHESTFSLNNHGVFQAHGLMALAMSFDNLPDCENYKNYANHLMTKLAVDQFDENGIHTEHSPHYHFYVLATFKAVLKSQWYKDQSSLTERMNLAHSACKWLIDPLKRVICVGDSILTAQDKVEFPDTNDDIISSNFDTSGYQIVRSGWSTPPNDASMLFFMGAYHSKTHKHRDCLSFDWFEKGGRIICDGGKYGYKSDKFRHYCLSYRAHNSVEIDGFDILKISPYGSAVEPVTDLGNGIFKLLGKLEYKAIKHKREIYFKPGHWLIVEDCLDFVKKRDITRWFHFDKDFRLISLIGNSLKVVDGLGRYITADSIGPSFDLELHQGMEDEISGYVSQKDYEISPALTIALRSKEKIGLGRYHMVFALSDASREEAFRYVSRNLREKRH